MPEKNDVVKLLQSQKIEKKPAKYNAFKGIFQNRDADRGDKNSAVAPTVADPKKKKRKRRIKAKGICDGKPFIDLTDVPPQPLILKNELSRTGYKDNSRRRPVADGSSKYTGVYFCKQTKKWRAQIMVDCAVRSIGSFEEEEEAAADYARAAFKYKFKESRELHAAARDPSGVPAIPLIRSETSASGYKGIKKMKGRWQARIQTGGKCATLGTFDTAEEAAGVYARALHHLKRRGGSDCVTAVTAARDYGTRVGDAGNHNDKNDKCQSDGNPVDVMAGGGDLNHNHTAADDRI